MPKHTYANGWKCGGIWSPLRTYTPTNGGSVVGYDYPTPQYPTNVGLAVGIYESVTH
jgi:hypothetical protein